MPISVGLTLALNGAADPGLLHAEVPLRFSRTGLAILLGGLGVVLVDVGLSLGSILRRTARGALVYE